MKNNTELKKKIITIYKKSKIFFTEKELEGAELKDYGLNDFTNLGLGQITYTNTERVCAKELALLPYQLCPQHKHPTLNNLPGKEETFRCRWGKVFLYMEGDGKINDINAKIPKEYKDKFSVFHEVILNPGDQYILQPDIWHWFQAGPNGAVLSEFSTQSNIEGIIFYDKNAKMPVISK